MKIRFYKTKNIHILKVSPQPRLRSLETVVQPYFERRCEHDTQSNHVPAAARNKTF